MLALALVVLSVAATEPSWANKQPDHFEPAEDGGVLHAYHATLERVFFAHGHADVEMWVTPAFGDELSVSVSRPEDPRAPAQVVVRRAHRSVWYTHAGLALRTVILRDHLEDRGWRRPRVGLRAVRRRARTDDAEVRARFVPRLQDGGCPRAAGHRRVALDE